MRSLRGPLLTLPVLVAAMLSDAAGAQPLPSAGLPDGNTPKVLQQPATPFADDSVFSPEADEFPGGEIVEKPPAGGSLFAEQFSRPAFADGTATESSGSWLSSGRTYAFAEAVILVRDSYFAVPLAVDASAGSDGLLSLGAADLSVEASPRFTLGRYLFRDPENRDHSWEFVYHGAGHWSARQTLESRSTDALLSSIEPFTGSATAIGGFNLSSRQIVEYTSGFDSFEVNYRVTSRMGRDQLVLQPSGQWLRRANTGVSYSVGAGIRFLELSELFRYTAFGANPATRNGDLLIGTDNDLIGFQLVAAWTKQHRAWNWGVRGKVGPYVNAHSQSTRLEVNDLVLRGLSRTEKIENETLAFIGQLGVFAKYHIRPNLSLRVAYEGLWIHSLALAGEQINFAPDGGRLNDGGSLFYMGVSLGGELTW